MNTSCLPLLTALEQLHLLGRASSLRVRLGSSWRQLTALQTAQLSGRLLCGEREGPGLPPSLTWLCIENDSKLDGDEDGNLHPRRLDEGVSAALCCSQLRIPLHVAAISSCNPGATTVQRHAHLPCHCLLAPQVLAELPVLQSLMLAECGYSSSSLAAVSGLSSLARLALHTVSALPPPAALGALAHSLRALEVHSALSDFGADTLEAAMTALTALELLQLDLEVVDGVAPHMPLAIAHAPQLSAASHVALSFYSDEPGACQGLWHGAFPILPWDSVRWLALPLEAAFLLAFRLGAVEQLETLCLLLPGAGEQLEAALQLEVWLATDAWSSLWRFCCHPPASALPAV